MLFGVEASLRATALDYGDLVRSKKCTRAQSNAAREKLRAAALAYARGEALLEVEPEHCGGCNACQGAVPQ